MNIELLKFSNIFHLISDSGHPPHNPYCGNPPPSPPLQSCALVLSELTPVPPLAAAATKGDHRCHVPDDGSASHPFSPAPALSFPFYRGYSTWVPRKAPSSQHSRQHTGHKSPPVLSSHIFLGVSIPPFPPGDVDPEAAALSGPFTKTFITDFL